MAPASTAPKGIAGKSARTLAGTAPPTAQKAISVHCATNSVRAKAGAPVTATAVRGRKELESALAPRDRGAPTVLVLAPVVAKLHAQDTVFAPHLLATASVIEATSRKIAARSVLEAPPTSAAVTVLAMLIPVCACARPDGRPPPAAVSAREVGKPLAPATELVILRLPSASALVP